MVSFQPPLWALVGSATPTILVGLWALWDAHRAPRCPVQARVAMGVSLAALTQWTVFLAVRAMGVWDAAEYERMAAPLRILVLSPIGGWGIWFTMHWFSRSSVRNRATKGGGTTADSGGRLEGG